jgi:hypothetical protein
MRRIARALARAASAAPPAAQPPQLAARVPPWSWAPHGVAGAWPRWLSGSAADAAPPLPEDALLASGVSAPPPEGTPQPPRARRRRATAEEVARRPSLTADERVAAAADRKRRRALPCSPQQPLDPRSVAFLAAKGVGTEEEVHALLVRARASALRNNFPLESIAEVYAFLERISGDATHGKRGSDTRTPLPVLMVQARGACSTCKGLACAAR